MLKLGTHWNILNGFYVLVYLCQSVLRHIRTLGLCRKKESNYHSQLENTFPGNIKFLKILFCVVFNIGSISQNFVF